MKTELDHFASRIPKRAIVGLGATHGLLLVFLLAGCQDSQNPLLSEVGCGVPSGEFPPTDCALVMGVARNQTGAALARLPIRVDSTIPTVGYAYASGPTSTDEEGRFELKVYRIQRLTTPGSPDTTRIGIKGYAVGPASPGQAPTVQAMVLLRFAPFGAKVTPSVVEAHFALPE